MTNYEAGFNAAYDILKATKNDEYGAPGCQNVIIFLTDGKITVGSGKDGQNEDALYAHIDDLDEDWNAVFFTFTLGEEAGAPEDLE